MALFGISDLHLSLFRPKAKDMAVFGNQWDKHWLKIEESWREQISADDIVLVPGDFSWATRAHEVAPDLEWFGALPGRKVIVKGNHDFWWNSYKKLCAMLPEGVYAIQNNAIELDDYIFFGSRGWDVMPGEGEDPTEWERIFKREVSRLRLSIEAMQKQRGTREPICLMHYPPLIEHDRPTPLSDLIESSGTRFCVYGHLHGEAGWIKGFKGKRREVKYQLLSCDYLKFKPRKLAPQSQAM